ncbi:amino acid ABC transporter permease [Pseudonocardia pini]|uniref:amino acid ABC transporter permease n=1 Tax=Pseudonocardia pini TaxID=2758030 RepID=UPI0015EFFCA7|nr:amino acid ABC transporter permease [Pseudonocardia pini]
MTATRTAGGTEGAEEVIPPSVQTAEKVRWGRWIAAAVVLVVLVQVVLAAAVNENIEWSVVGDYLFDPQVLHGLQTTLLLAVSAEVITIVLGLLLVYARLSSNPLLRGFAGAYVWFFRSVPLIVQILLLGNLALFAPDVSVSIPFTSVVLFSQDTNDLIPAATAAVLALALHDAAYNAEIFRSGIGSVPEGQRRAASALGLTWWQTQRKVVLPQAFPVIIPPAASQFITLLKSTALVSVIAVPDLLTEAQTISNRNARVMELLFVATAWFMVMVAVASLAVRWLERRSATRNRRLATKPVEVVVQP